MDVRYQRKKLQKQKVEDYRKRLVVFEKPEGVSIVEYLESLKEKDTSIRNYLLFMKTLGKPIIAQVTDCKQAVAHYPDNIMGEVLEDGCQCHEITLLCTLRDPKLRTFFGFADEYRDGKYYQTFSHSFNVSDCQNFLFDMSGQYTLHDYKNIDKFKDRVRNYFGVEIPLPIVEQIYHKRPKGYYANHARDIRNEIFPSRNKTLRFIKRIQKLQDK